MSKSNKTTPVATDPATGAGTPPAATAELLAQVGQRIDALESAHAAATAAAGSARDELQDLWATPVAAQQFADLVVTHLVDKAVANFYQGAGIANILGMLAEPLGFRPTAPVDRKMALTPPEKVAKLLRGGARPDALGQTGERLCAADVIALSGGRLGDFENMAQVPQGAILGVISNDDRDSSQQRSLLAAALAVFGGEEVRRQVHDWALAFYREKYGESADVVPLPNTDELCARIQEKQQAVAELQARLGEIEDELVSLPPMHFDRHGRMTAQAQAAARAKRNLPPVFGPST